MHGLRAGSDRRRFVRRTRPWRGFQQASGPTGPILTQSEEVGPLHTAFCLEKKTADEIETRVSIFKQRVCGTKPEVQNPLSLLPLLLRQSHYQFFLPLPLTFPAAPHHADLLPRHRVLCTVGGGSFPRPGRSPSGIALPFPPSADPSSRPLPPRPGPLPRRPPPRRDRLRR
jgi:hypothetical protein